MSIINRTLALAVFGLLVCSIAVAHTDGIYNPTANSVGDTQGIDSNGAGAVQPTGDILMVDAVSLVLQTDAASFICRAGGC
jgi:hypothetical protein